MTPAVTLPEQAQPVEKMCSKCHKNRVNGKHPWCNPCRAAYQAEYRQIEIERAFNAGALAMRNQIAANFAKAGPQGITTMLAVIEALARQPLPDLILE